MKRPLPSGFDPWFFNVASADQQLSELGAGARLVLDHLHPTYPRLETTLDYLALCAVVTRPAGRPVDLDLHCDTLTIDTDRSVATLIWRGHVPLEHPDQAGTVVVTLSRVMAACVRDEVEAATQTAVAPLEQARPALPFTAPHGLGDAAEDEDVVQTAIPRLDRARPALPFMEPPSAMAEGPGADEDVVQTAIPRLDRARPTLPFMEPSITGYEEAESDVVRTALPRLQRRPVLPFTAQDDEAGEGAETVDDGTETIAPSLVAMRPALPFAPRVTTLAASPPEPPPGPPQPPSSSGPAPAASSGRGVEPALLPVDVYAQIKLEIWGAGCPMDEVLARHGIDEIVWRVNERRQADALDRKTSNRGRSAALELAAALCTARARAGGRSARTPP